MDAVYWVFAVVFCYENDSQGKKCSALRMDVIETGNKGHLARKAASRTESRDSAGYVFRTWGEANAASVFAGGGALTLLILTSLHLLPIETALEAQSLSKTRSLHRVLSSSRFGALI